MSCYIASQTNFYNFKKTGVQLEAYLLSAYVGLSFLIHNIPNGRFLMMSLQKTQRKENRKGYKSKDINMYILKVYVSFLICVGEMMDKARTYDYLITIPQKRKKPTFNEVINGHRNTQINVEY